MFWGKNVFKARVILAKNDGKKNYLSKGCLIGSSVN